MAIMEMVVYTAVGILAGIIAVVLFGFCKAKASSPSKFAGSYILLLIGLLLIGFSVDWGYGSFVEGEPQSAAIGFLVFGGIGIIFVLIGFRLAMLKPEVKTPQKAIAAE